MATDEERVFAVGERVRLSIDGSVEGVVTAELSPVGGMRRYQVFHGAGDIGEYYANQLSPFDESPQTASALTLEAFLASYAARKLTLPSYSSLFSLNAGKIKFIPYQFRPLKKIVKADRPRLLVADEVGVGKTIETGIIIKEFERRESIESILVVCPKELAPKWQREMKTRFDEPFSILDGPTLDYCIREMELEGEWPYQHAKCIAGLEMIRREETANKLMGLEDGLHFDMLVLDEAHHVVNTASNSYAILDYLSDCSDIAVFLSATPIQLRSRDLFVLLSLLLPEDFTNESLFNEMAEPNQYLNAAIRNIRSSTKEGWQERASDALSHVVGSSAWASARYGGNRQLTYWCDRLPGDALSDEERMSCLRDLEDLHSFAHVINRTKRRDIGEFTLREPVTVEIAYSSEEQAFYEAAHEFALGIYTAQHGTLVARMIMATIDRLMTSCLPAFAGMLDSFTSRGLLSIRGLSDDMDLDIDDVELTDTLVGLAGELKVLAERLPERDAKTEKLIDIIKETSAGDEDGKLLVFSFFKHTLRYLKRNVSKAGVRCAVITGDSPSEERDKLRERFRLPKEDPFAIDVLLSSEVGCEGLDYEFCSRMVNYDIPWNPMKIEQRIGRIDRFGQKSPKVRIYNFITQGTVEERIFFRCFERLGIFSSTVGDLEGVLGGVESDLTKIAYDLSLSDEQKAEKAQQGIDNAIRDAEEQREFESNSKDLFLMDLATEDEIVGSERDMQMALLQRLLVEYLSAACPSSQFEIVNPGQVRARMFRSDKDRLLKKLVKLRRARKVESASDQYKQLEWYLQSDAQVIALDFDGSKESDPESALFVSLSNPLVVMAIDEQPVPTSSQNVTLATRSPILPKGTYSFACCEWEQKGYRNTTDIEAVVLDGRTGAPVDMGLVDFEALLLSCETAWYEEEPDVAALDELLYRKQVAAKKRLA
ncbi:MAG: SNF2-related protein, partial [Eggerthellales bacterium]|nr:SNF2-related protein [Eggerthellales bacterium]